MTKDELIKEAWGLILDTLNNEEAIDYILSNEGYLIDEKFMYTTEDIVFWCGIELKKHPFDNHKYRPKSLQFIEDNNGWIKIESEEDLPKIEMQDCFIMDKTLGVIVGRFTLSEKNIWLENATHYQPIEKPKPPIF